MFNETLTRYKLCWMVIAFSGVALIMLGGQQQDQDPGQYVYGVGFPLTAAFFYAITTAITKALHDVYPCLIVFIQLGVGCLILLPVVSLPTAFSVSAVWGCW
ncbi:MAG: hypothetical protein ACR5LF_16145 [Symbiopectobacterium sp.]